NAFVIDDWLLKMKNERDISQKRVSFTRELKVLRTIFRWYEERSNNTFRSPILKRHFKESIVSVDRSKNKKMERKELALFLNNLGEESDVLFKAALTQGYQLLRAS